MTPEPKCGPPEYCARTDRDVEQVPSTVPALGPAGSIIRDPAFSSRILRVTDKSTESDRPDISYHTPSSAEQNSWNTNSTKFYLEASGGHVLLYNFDPVTMSPAYSQLNLSPPWALWHSEPEFSYVDANVIYGLTGGYAPKFQRYDFSTGRAVNLHDTATCIGLKPSESGLDLSVSGDDNRLLGVLGPRQDEDEWIYVYDKKLGCRWYNTSTGKVGGQWGPVGTISLNDSFLVHNARISKNGEYVAIVGNPLGLVLWHVGTLNATLCRHDQPDSCGGHWTMGYSHLVNSSGVRDPMNILIRPLDNPAWASPLIAVFPGSTVWFSKHLSWNNATPGDTSPVCLSTFRDDNVAAPGVPLKVGRAWENEILCVRTDGKSSVVWRFAHTFSSATSGFWSTPRGNVSQDGRFYMFTSDWENTLGVEPRGRTYRTDAFIVELK